MLFCAGGACGWLMRGDGRGADDAGGRGSGTNDTVKRYRYAKQKLGRTNSGRSYIVKKSTYD